MKIINEIVTLISVKLHADGQVDIFVDDSTAERKVILLEILDKVKQDLLENKTV